MEKVSHHYVPQFYLRNFSENYKSVGMFINRHKSYVRQASIKKQACKDYLYGKEQTIEDTLMDIEYKVSIIIKRIINSYELPQKETEDYYFLMMYILLQEARVQRQAESMNNFTNQMAKVVARMYKEHGRLDVEDEVINEMNITMDIPNLTFMQAAVKTYPIMLDLKVSLILIKNDRMFITSDNPVVRYNYMYVVRNYRLRGYGLGNMGIQVFFPISPKCCIYIYDHIMYDTKISEQNTIELTKGKHVDELNKLFYLNSYEFLFFNENIKETYIKRIVSQNSHSNNVNEEVNMLGSTSNKLINYQQRTVRDKINMPFLRINSKFINMPLPNHMAGPIRPYAEKLFPEED